MTTLDPRTAIMEAEMSQINRKARKARKAVKLDDFDAERRANESKPKRRWHMAYDPKDGQEARHLRPRYRASILGIDPYRP